MGRSPRGCAISSAIIADLVVEGLLAGGIQNLFGMPGGGSGTELLEAAQSAGLPFILSHTEEAGAFMACAQAEILGRPAACLATLGPGAASITNGVAHAYLDRVGLVVLTDRHPTGVRDFALHQTLDHSSLFAPITKGSWDLGSDVETVLERALRVAVEAPAGPVHIDCSPDVLTEPAPEWRSKGGSPPATHDAPSITPEVAGLLRAARRPLIIVGLAARRPGDASSIRALCEANGIPGLVTYKAKGTLPDTHPLFAGVFTDGALESRVLALSDLVIAVGLDPVELLPKRWEHRQPIIYCGPPLGAQRQLPFAATISGYIPSVLESLAPYLVTGAWDLREVARLADAQRDSMRVPCNGLAPHRVVELVADKFASVARVTVDAGAHMFPTLALWPTSRPNDLLISNGLSTMGFALPSAVGAALLDRERTVVAMTGDGGLLMCIAELKTAVRENLRVRVIVFDDCSLSLIRIKQEERGYKASGVDLGRTDWCKLASAFEVPAFVADSDASLRRTLADCDEIDGPALIAARIDASGYRETMRRLRG